MLPNPKRGDVTVSLRHPISGDPVELILRPSFDAIAAIESRTVPRSIFRLLSDMIESRDLPLTVAAAIVWAGVNAYRRDEGQAGAQIAYEHAGAMLRATPVQDWMPSIIAFLTNCTSTPDSREEAGKTLGNAASGA
jgi:hypothetical protein